MPLTALWWIFAAGLVLATAGSAVAILEHRRAVWRRRNAPFAIGLLELGPITPAQDAFLAPLPVVRRSQDGKNRLYEHEFAAPSGRWLLRVEIRGNRMVGFVLRHPNGRLSEHARGARLIKGR